MNLFEFEGKTLDEAESEMHRMCSAYELDLEVINIAITPSRYIIFTKLKEVGK